ncbi:hypothetical protein DRQ07_07450 [candidate division KSB1 bacterium]|nr:MAG: hypothetical protein DRQ07_07450 [candidate division KSB1 bacterium]
MYSKISDPITVIGETLKMGALSREEVKEHLEMLENPETAKEVSIALLKMKKGSTVEAATSSKVIQTIILALMTYLGSVFADPGVKKDFALMLKKHPVTMEEINTFKEQIPDIQKKLDELNKVLKDRSGMDKPGFSSIVIGDKKLIAKNEHEHRVLEAMRNLVNELKKSKAKKIITDETYKNKIQALVDAFESGSKRPISFA